ncbi:N-acetylmuramoyl-L-alanine amidase [Acinetobacter sp. WZC-1]|uniref:N-acetylmuramoyl-L-alanine amidase n=1 Tax=Acinetobacter sp. WZC-1 TaxID=3459034 RepID=UPI00403DB057
MFTIDYNSHRSVKGFNRRTRFLVIHFTAADFATSVKLLSGDGGVSSHYLIPDPTEDSYKAAGFNDIRIFNLVDEQDRAWHAGASLWAGRNNLNDSSIGIEIVNLASEDQGVFTFPPFNALQIEAMKQLGLNIIQRYPDISPPQVVAHSDIAIGRKSDPGPSFPWKELYDAGIGAWYDEDIKNNYEQQFDAAGLPSSADIKVQLNKYGYDVAGADTEQGFTQLIRAFQLHFRQEKYDGVPDRETVAIIYALVEKYFPAE